MSVRLTFNGLDQFRRALQQAPEELRREADEVIRETAADAARSVESGYPEGPTGNLKRGVTMQHNSSKFGTVGVVRSRAKHASIFERGTVQRQTRRGANRGSMPQPPEAQRAIPKFVRARQRMMSSLIEIVRQAGFQVDA